MVHETKRDERDVVRSSSALDVTSNVLSGILSVKEVMVGTTLLDARGSGIDRDV